MVRRQYNHDLAGVFPSQRQGGQPDGRRGVPAEGLDNDIVFRQLRDLLQNNLPEFRPRHDICTGYPHQPFQPLHRQLQHGLVSD